LSKKFDCVLSKNTKIRIIVSKFKGGGIDFGEETKMEIAK